MTDFIGIYWTRPVPWARFSGADTDIEKAVRQSKTIRYQFERVKRYAHDAQGRVVEHIVLNDLHPDRASPETAADLAKRLSKLPEAVVSVWVDFSRANGWRRHPYMNDLLAKRHSIALEPDEIFIDGQHFDPVQHFRKWQEAASSHASAKEAHSVKIREALALHSDHTWACKANVLNDLGFLTHGGKTWTSDNLRKFLRRDDT